MEVSIEGLRWWVVSRLSLPFHDTLTVTANDFKIVKKKFSVLSQIVGKYHHKRSACLGIMAAFINVQLFDKETRCRLNLL